MMSSKKYNIILLVHYYNAELEKMHLCFQYTKAYIRNIKVLALLGFEGQTLYKMR